MLIPRKGKGLELELDLGKVRVLRAFQSKGDFWDSDQSDNQLLIRDSEAMRRFLPRVVYDRGLNTALFELMRGRREWACRSRGTGRNLPSAEVQDFQDALDAWRCKAADPRCDPDNRKVIASFRLPDPATMPECYRVYGPFWDRRMLVLWGYETHGGTSIDPAQVAERLTARIDRTYGLKKVFAWLLLILLCAALLGSALLLWWHRATRPLRSDPEPAPTEPAGATITQMVQYLHVEPLTVLAGMPVTASVRRAGAVDFASQRTFVVEADRPVVYDGFRKPGKYCVQWQPRDTALNNEAIHVEVLNVVDARGNALFDATPVANLRLMPEYAAPGEPVHADASASYAKLPGVELELAEIQWPGREFAALTATNRKHVFHELGDQVVKLRVTDANGSSAMDQAVVHVGIQPPTNSAPVAAMKVLGFDPVERTLAVEGLADDAEDGTPAMVMDWGDGVTSIVHARSNAALTHTYAEPGVYTAALTAVDRDGVSSPDSAAFELTVPPSEQEADQVLCSSEPLAPPVPNELSAVEVVPETMSLQPEAATKHAPQQRVFEIVKTSDRALFELGQLEVVLAVRDARQPEARDFKVEAWSFDGRPMQNAGRVLLLSARPGQHEVEALVVCRDVEGREHKVNVAATVTAELIQQGQVQVQPR